MNNVIVGMAGSRGLGSEVQGMVDRVVGSVVAAGRTVATGCAVGADSMALRARLAVPMVESTSRQALQVFAVGGREGHDEFVFIDWPGVCSAFFVFGGFRCIRTKAISQLMQQ